MNKYINPVFLQLEPTRILNGWCEDSLAPCNFSRLHPKACFNKSKAKSLEASDIKESNIYIYIPLRIMMIVSPRACSGVDAGFEGSILLSRGALKLCCGRM